MEQQPDTTRSGTRSPCLRLPARMSIYASAENTTTTISSCYFAVKSQTCILCAITIRSTPLNQSPSLPTTYSCSWAHIFLWYCEKLKRLSVLKGYCVLSIFTSKSAKPSKKLSSAFNIYSRTTGGPSARQCCVPPRGLQRVRIWSYYWRVMGGSLSRFLSKRKRCRDVLESLNIQKSPLSQTYQSHLTT